MIRILIIWLINALALFVLPYIISSIQIRGFGTALVAAVVLGLINALIRPLLVLLTLPVTMITLGLFIFVINALLFQFAAWMLKGFEVADFWSALFGSILSGLVDTWKNGIQPLNIMFYQATMRQRARLHCRLISVKDPDDYPRKTGLKLNNKSEIFNEILYVNDAARKTLFAFHTAHLCGVRIRPGRNQPFSARCNS